MPLFVAPPPEYKLTWTDFLFFKKTKTKQKSGLNKNSVYAYLGKPQKSYFFSGRTTKEKEQLFHNR